MSFTVQTDAGDAVGANALVSVAEFAAWHTDRGIDLTSYTTTAQQVAIVKATDFMATRWIWIGTAITTDTPWPRSAAYLPDASLVTGIPKAVKRACFEYALLSLLGTVLSRDPNTDSTGRLVTQESVSAGPVSKTTTYAVPTKRPNLTPAYPIPDLIVIRSGLVINSSNLVRA